MKSNVRQKQEVSWKVIILLLIFFWPVGLFLLYRKISTDKAAMLKNSKTFNTLSWIFIGLAAIYLIMVITGDTKTENGSSNPEAFIAGFIFFGLGGVLLRNVAKRMKINAEKFKKYIAIVINDNQTSIDNIAASVPVSYQEAVKDLQKMIDDGYFEGAYINASNREIILLNGKNAQEHSKINAKLDDLQLKAVVCRNCGGNNKVVEGQVCECEYCGSLLS